MGALAGQQRGAEGVSEVQKSVLVYASQEEKLAEEFLGR
jgi:hypothetical protein